MKEPGTTRKDRMKTNGQMYRALVHARRKRFFECQRQSADSAERQRREGGEMHMSNALARSMRIDLVVGAAIATIAALLLAAAPAAWGSASCPNEQFRTGPGASLPDCRAYEQVTPVDKNDQSAPSTRSGIILEPQVSTDGDRAAYFSLGDFAGAPAGASFYLARRGEGSWSTQNIAPALGSDPEPGCFSEYPWDSPDLSRGILSLGVSFECGVDEPPLVAGEPEGVDVRNMFLRDNSTGSYQLIDVTPPGVTPATPVFEGGSTDLAHVVFAETAQLTPEASPSGSNLFEWTSGSVSLVSLTPPSGQTSCSGSACVPATYGGLGYWPGERVAHAVSDDGSRVFFSNSTGALYLREGDTTTQVDASQGGSGASGGGAFMTASADGSSVIFTDVSKLTADSTATSGSPDLYRYEVGNGKLTDLTVDATDPNGADVLGLVGAGEDDSYLYFVAEGVLATNPNSRGDTATLGQPNLYLWHAGATRFIATLDPADQDDWRLSERYGAHVTPDGAHLAFNSIRSLTGYDNVISDGSSSCGVQNNGNPSGNPHCNEVYLYNASTNGLACASCNPSGTRPQGASWARGVKSCNYCSSETNWSLTRNLSEDGSRLFFDSEDALVPGDTNGVRDVYEWEQDGIGSCESSAQGGGCVHLISSGRSGNASIFYEASASGDDVMFTTYQSLVGQDDDGLGDLYDARVDGGLASQNPLPTTPCSGEECRSALTTPPTPLVAASTIFSGAGNLTPVKPARKMTNSRRALKRCKAKHPRNRRKLRGCRRRARRRLNGANASGRRDGRHVRRVHRGAHGGAR